MSPQVYGGDSCMGLEASMYSDGEKRAMGLLMDLKEKTGAGKRKEGEEGEASPGK